MEFILQSGWRLKTFNTSGKGGSMISTDIRADSNKETSLETNSVADFDLLEPSPELLS